MIHLDRAGDVFILTMDAGENRWNTTFVRHLAEALNEVEAIAKGTRCKQPLFSVSLNPPQQADVSIEQFEETMDRIEKRLNLEDQPRAVVFHEKLGRRHAHCIWSRIDVDQMQAINLPFYKNRLMEILDQVTLN